MTYTLLIVISLLVIVFIFFLIKRYRAILESERQKFASEIEHKSALEAEQLKVALEVERREDLERKLNEAQDFISFLNGLSMSKSDKQRREYNEVIDYARKNLISEIYSLTLSLDPNNFLNRFNAIESFLEKWVEKINKPWIGDNLVIAFVGKYSSGKSSIVNTILGKDLLPIDVTPTTAVPTYIYYEPKGIVCKIEESDGEIKSISEDLLKKISHERSKSMPLSLIIKNLVIGYPNDILKNVSILDTPGYDSVNYKDKRRTLEAIKESDVVFWVVDVNDGSIRSDALEFIENHMSDKNLYIVVNKVDLKPPKEVELVKSKIVEQLEKNGVKLVEVFLFSSRDHSYGSSLLGKIKDIALSYENNKVGIYSFLKSYVDDLSKVIQERKRKLKGEKRKLEKVIVSLTMVIKKEIARIKKLKGLKKLLELLANDKDKLLIIYCRDKELENKLKEIENYNKRLQKINANLQKFRDKLIKEGLL